MKQLGVIVLSLLVLFAGAGWALDGCWNHENHAAYAAGGIHQDVDSSLQHSHRADDSFAVIDCCSFVHEIEAVTTSGAARLDRPTDRLSSVPVNSMLAELAASSRSTALDSRAGPLSFVYFTDTPYHLFLSILHL